MANLRHLASGRPGTALAARRAPRRARPRPPSRRHGARRAARERRGRPARRGPAGAGRPACVRATPVPMTSWSGAACAATCSRRSCTAATNCRSSSVAGVMGSTSSWPSRLTRQARYFTGSSSCRPRRRPAGRRSAAGWPAPPRGTRRRHRRRLGVADVDLAHVGEQRQVLARREHLLDHGLGDGEVVAGGAVDVVGPQGRPPGVMHSAIGRGSGDTAPSPSAMTTSASHGMVGPRCGRAGPAAAPTASSAA